MDFMDFDEFTWIYIIFMNLDAMIPSITQTMQLANHVKWIVYDASGARKSYMQHMQHSRNDIIIENQFLKDQYFSKIILFLV